MITLGQHLSNIRKLLDWHPEWADLPIIYASDDEGNSYHNVYNLPIPAQVHDIKEHYLELVDIYIEEKDAQSEDISRDDVNCIIIN